MTKYFNFTSLINKYSRELVVLKKTGDWNSLGDWVEQTSEHNIHGAILGINENKIYRSEGTLTAQDKILYMLTPIDDALMSGMVIFNGNKYNIEGQTGTDNSDFTGVYTYTLKFVSAFN